MFNKHILKCSYCKIYNNTFVCQWTSGLSVYLSISLDMLEYTHIPMSMVRVLEIQIGYPPSNYWFDPGQRSRVGGLYVRFLQSTKELTGLTPNLQILKDTNLKNLYKIWVTIAQNQVGHRHVQNLFSPIHTHPLMYENTLAFFHSFLCIV